ncbi:jg23214 [Pararge aegeria aegeria]|uniref:Jg23214 protein n=1 Tax=Pararge aegeria aegeria TaxID=348720 RepID=A0A8S4S2M2_9NEOP|nr:jg23214 [Pararge aegeria aegeria]
MTYGSETWSLTMVLIRRLKSHLTSDGKSYVSSVFYVINSEEIRRRMRVTNSSTSRKAEVAIGGAHSSDNRWILDSQDVGRPREQTTLNESRGAGPESWSLEHPT